PDGAFFVFRSLTINMSLLTELALTRFRNPLLSPLNLRFICRRTTPLQVERAQAIFYGLLVIFAQFNPWVAAYLAKAFSFWMRTARTTLESSARPSLRMKS